MKTQEQYFRDSQRKLADKNRLIEEIRREYLSSGMTSEEIWNQQAKVNERSRVFKDLKEVEKYIKSGCLIWKNY